MASLHFITQETKLLLRYLLLGTLGIIVLIIGFRLIVQVKDYFFPTPIIAPEARFGKLPKLPFPTQKLPFHFTYTIDTISGVLPVFPDRAKVFKIQESTPNLLNLRNTQLNIGHTEFQGNPGQISDTTYQWITSSSFEKKLVYNIVTQNFTITSSYQENATISATRIATDKPTLIREAKTFITALSPFPSDIDETKIRVSSYTLSNNLLLPVNDLSKAQIARIDFFQKDIQKLPIYYPNSFYSPMYILFAHTDQDEVIEASFLHQSLTNVSSTYAIKSPQEAINELKQGHAYITSYPSNSSKIIIHEITLGYYMSDQSQKYLMPIIILKGDNNFIAYVSAITDAWVQK